MASALVWRLTHGTGMLVHTHMKRLLTFDTVLQFCIQSRTIQASCPTPVLKHVCIRTYCVANTYSYAFCRNSLVHEVPRFIWISGVALKEQLAANTLMDHELMSIILRRYSQLDMESDPESPTSHGGTQLNLNSRWGSTCIIWYCESVLIEPHDNAFTIFCADSRVIRFRLHPYRFYAESVCSRLGKVRTHICTAGMIYE